MDAAERWSGELAAWAIPAEILDTAPESPWGFPPRIFARAAEDALTPTASPSVSAARAREALQQGGTVVDVGIGGGAASLPLAPPATHVTGVDESAGMLAAFAQLARARGLAHTLVEGRWPDVAGRVPPADVVVCHHVFYNVSALVPFVTALTERARRTVVVELTATHPQAALNGLWRRFWGIERPTGPDAGAALAVLRDMRLEVSIDSWETPARWGGAPREELVAFVRRRLCLPAERDAEISAALEPDFELAPRQLATLWWPGSAPAQPS